MRRRYRIWPRDCGLHWNDRLWLYWGGRLHGGRPRRAPDSAWLRRRLHRNAPYRSLHSNRLRAGKRWRRLADNNWSLFHDSRRFVRTRGSLRMAQEAPDIRPQRSRGGDCRPLDVSLRGRNNGRGYRAALDERAGPHQGDRLWRVAEHVLDIRDIDVRDVDVHHVDVDAAVICRAAIVRRHVHFMQRQGKPPNVVADHQEDHERRGEDRPYRHRTWHPGPYATDQHPAAIVERCEAPRGGVDPGPPPR